VGYPILSLIFEDLWGKYWGKWGAFWPQQEYAKNIAGDVQDFNSLNI